MSYEARLASGREIFRIDDSESERREAGSAIRERTECRNSLVAGQEIDQTCALVVAEPDIVGDENTEE